MVFACFRDRWSPQPSPTVITKPSGCPSRFLTWPMVSWVTADVLVGWRLDGGKAARELKETSTAAWCDAETHRCCFYSSVCSIFYVLSLKFHLQKRRNCPRLALWPFDPLFHYVFLCVFILCCLLWCLELRWANFPAEACWRSRLVIATGNCTFVCSWSRFCDSWTRVGSCCFFFTKNV